MSRYSRPISRRVVAAATTAVLALAVAHAPSAVTPVYLADDPLAREPETRDASSVTLHQISDLYDRLLNLVGDPSDAPRDLRAQDVNTIDEVPDSSWFTNRAGSRTLTPEEVRRGPDLSPGPADGTWTVVSGKDEGATSGFEIVDAGGGRWLLKFDGREHPGMASSAEVISTKLLWALGYNVPENHVVAVHPDRLQVDAKAMLQPFGARVRYMRQADVANILRDASPNGDGTYRAVASLHLPGTPVGRFDFVGTRPDDPNDVVPHEHRRELRALRVFSAWINHTEIRGSNTFDTLVPAADGTGQRVRHHLIDFGSTLGSWTFTARPRRSGFETAWQNHLLLGRMFTLGWPVPGYAVMPVTESPELGRLPDADRFDPDTWAPRVSNAAFKRLRDDDRFWAARRLAALDDALIEAAVDAARVPSAEVRQVLLRFLVGRRDRIVAKYASAALPVANLSIDDAGRLRVEEMRVPGQTGGVGAGWRVRWSAFDNVTGAETPVDPGVGESLDAMALPASFVAARGLASNGGSEPGACAAATLDRPGAPQFAGMTTRGVFCRFGDVWRLVGLDRKRQ